MAKFEKGKSGNPGGRPKVLAEVKAMAAKHGPDAIKTLARLVVEADSDAAKIAACRELLDRAYGKATQPIAGDDEGAAIRVINEIVLRGVRSDQDH